MSKEHTTVTVNTPELAFVLGVKPGGQMKVETRKGVPINKEWRNRFRDSHIDGCITIAQNDDKPKAKSVVGKPKDTKDEG